MLRIEEDATTAKTVRLRLHGRLVGEWVGILRAICENALALELAVVLDLTGVSYADLLLVNPELDGLVADTERFRRIA